MVSSLAKSGLNLKVCNRRNVTFPSSANCRASGDVGKGPSLCQSKPAGCQEAGFLVGTNTKGHLLANTSRKSTKDFVCF